MRPAISNRTDRATRLGATSVSLTLIVAFGCSGPRDLNVVEATLSTTNPVDFGDVGIGTTRTEALRLRNSGNGDLLVQDVRLIGDDAFNFDMLGASKIGPTSEVLWEVSFAPTVEGTLDAKMLIQSNHEGGQLVEVSLVGVGIISCIDADQDGFGEGCVNGSDCDDTNASIIDPSLWHQDTDSDSFGDPEVSQSACTAPSGFVDNSLDCDDTNSAMHPEVVWYRDFDGDLYGDPTISLASCEQPLNYVSNPDDCDDQDFTRHPGAIWYRDGDGDTYGTAFDSQTACSPPPNYVGNDSDCDDLNPDYRPGSTWYRDADNDTFGDPAVTTIDCMPTAGWVGNAGDCDDNDPANVPTTIWYRDADADTYGDAADTRLACLQPTGYVTNPDDCDDADADAFPGAVWFRDFDDDGFGNANISKVECLRTTGWVANDLDCNDDDNTIGALITWYKDGDADSYGNPGITQTDCTAPPGFVNNDLDCDDSNADVHPGASETTAAECADGIDNDCDGEPDSFDSTCTAVDCGEPAHYLTTDNCGSDYPANTGAQLCEEYPNSPYPVGQQEQCMTVCRNSSECPAGQACYPSRRSLNLHFCAPVLGNNLAAAGESCAVDADCATALCHFNTCREPCVRDADCGGAGMICRAEIRTHAYIGNEISTGVCQPRDNVLLPLGSPCTTRVNCQSGICAQSSATGPHLCRRSCGSENDCGADRCAGALYDSDPNVGYGYRACSEAPTLGTAGVGQSCYSAILGDWIDIGCHSLFCDSTYCPNGMANVTTCAIEPYCGGLCDRDSDCPLLFPGNFNLQMRCLITSSSIIQPLIGGYCAPFFCETTADCEQGRTCYLFNPAPKEYPAVAAGICR